MVQDGSLEYLVTTQQTVSKCSVLRGPYLGTTRNCTPDTHGRVSSYERPITTRNAGTVSRFSGLIKLVR
jgi:hypothetical protein